MEEIKIFALCVRAEDYGENGKILTLITAENGKTVARIRSARGPKSKLKQCASPFCIGEYILTRGKGDKFIVTGCSVEESFFSLWTDVNKNVCGSVVIEALDRFTESGVSAKGELIQGVKSLYAIASAQTEPYVYCAHFLISLLPAEGIDITEFDLPSSVREAIKAISASDIEDLETLDITESELGSALAYINLIYRNKLGERLNSVAEALKLLSERP